MVLCLRFKQLKASVHDYLKYHSNNINHAYIPRYIHRIFIYVIRWV